MNVHQNCHLNFAAVWGTFIFLMAATFKWTSWWTVIEDLTKIEIPSEINIPLFKALVRADQLFQRLIKTLGRHGLHIDETSQRIHPGDTDNIRKCIVSGLFPNAAYLHMSGSFRTVRGDMEIAIQKNSVLFSLKQPSWVVFAEMVHSNRVLMRDVTVIDPTWLEILAPHYYEKISVRRW